MLGFGFPIRLVLPLRAGVCLILTTAPAMAASPNPAQNGDRKGQEQPLVDRQFEVPPAPALTPEQALDSFTIADGYRIECVASDPLIHDPVDIAFDARGRLWVVEMSTLMLDPDASGELEPKCAIAVLEDSDGDGIYDSRSEFVSDEVLPRSIAFVGDGVLAILPPQIVYLRDTDQDGVADQREVVDTGINAGLSNPEHAANGLTLGLDNWIYLANHGKRYRLQDGVWQIESVPQVGQWGLGEDAWGRRVYNYNSTPVHGDLVPTHYLVRNSALGRALGVNVRWATQNRVWPGRLNTGVNRGYQKGTLAENGRLANYTAACGPEVFTGTQLGPNDSGSVFVCEPSGNFVRQLAVREVDGQPKAQNAYEVERSEFLLSTDERFRPVNLANGPDGALYIVDLYRGILQHRVFLTSFLRRQIEERGLDKHTGLGRIWRVVHDSSDESEAMRRVDFTQLDELALVQMLYKPNAWSRRTAQQQLIARGMRAADKEGLNPKKRAALVDALEAVGRDRGQEFAQLHALWTLEGLGALRAEFLVECLYREQHAKLLANLIRLSEGYGDEVEVRQAWQWLLDHDAAEVRWQLAHSLGECEHPAALGQMVQLLARHPQDALLRSGVLSGLNGREAAALDRVLVHPGLQYKPQAFAQLCKELARCVVRHAQPEAIRRLAERALRHPQAAMRFALVQGMAEGVAKNPGDKRYRFAHAEPHALVELAASEDATLVERVTYLRARLQWAAEAVEPIALNEAHAAAVTRGAQIYSVSCGACHQTDGQGIAGLAPPLADSEWLLKSQEELAAIALFGLNGPIQVRGENWDMTMPGWAQLSNDELADVLSYVTAEWAPAPLHVQPELIRKVRETP
jgi:mono/diheme cytochrome c family protein/glucose/arabinose dehydrogenase